MKSRIANGTRLLRIIMLTIWQSLAIHWARYRGAPAHPDFPQDRWSLADDHAADAEGWNLYDIGGKLEIERNDVNDCEGAPHLTDKTALAHVTARAHAGSDLHIRALEIHDRYADPGLLDEDGFTGDDDGPRPLEPDALLPQASAINPDDRASPSRDAPDQTAARARLKRKSVGTVLRGRTSTVKEQPVCPDCASENVSADAAARWNFAGQCWEVTDVFDKGHGCDDCEQTHFRFKWRCTRLQSRAIVSSRPVPAH